MSALCVGDYVPGVLSWERDIVNPWTEDSSHPTVSESLVPALYPLAACRCPSEATDPHQVQVNEERVPQHPAVHHCLRLHQPLHQVLVLDSPRQGPVPALNCPESLGVCASVCLYMYFYPCLHLQLYGESVRHWPLDSWTCQLHRHSCSHCTYLDITSHVLRRTCGCKWHAHLLLSARTVKTRASWD